MPAETAPVLEALLTVRYGPGRRVLDGLRLRVEAGEVVGLAGESGSGKSTLALSLLGLLPAAAQTAGSIRFHGRELMGLPERRWRSLRGREIALVLQGAAGALNPFLTLGAHFREAWNAHQGSGPWREAAAPLLERVCLSSSREFLKRYPGEISIGQAQRVLIAMALLHRPRLVIADECTSALDLLTQAEILALLRELNRELGVAILFISHDLAAVASLCSRLDVMYRGAVVESGPPAELFARPAHPYTRALVGALPFAIPTSQRNRESLGDLLPA